MIFIPGKLYEITGSIDYSPVRHRFKINIKPNRPNSPEHWISLYPGEIVMWIGLKEFGDERPKRLANFILYKHHGLCLIEAIWDLTSLNRMLKLAS